MHHCPHWLQHLQHDLTWWRWEWTWGSRCHGSLLMLTPAPATQPDIVKVRTDMRLMLSWITANADTNICNIMTWHSGDENRHDDLCCHASLPTLTPTPVTWPDTAEMNMDMMRLTLSWITAHADSNTPVTWHRKQENKVGRHPGNSWNMHFHSPTNSRPKKVGNFCIQNTTRQKEPTKK